ncbi:hypothetical protein EDD31_1845 [Bogoriella caseilytica]|uniref:Transcriptional regulator with AbiEi antitoxin domain of type IV toxin-antitoxin system n=2 Tax=Bogoriella caseilytica TaxID=56055 RepID=A0A3N2BEJ5_9MICO|nr:hypothetical protein EDD31_1845 [Bogoriella caseilytica]
MDENQVRSFTDRFDELGIQVDLAELVERPNARVTLQHPTGQANYHVVYTEPLTLSEFAKEVLAVSPPSQLLLLGPRVTERTAEAFRQLDLNYLDQAGNAFITFGGVHIDVRGKRQSPLAQRTQVARPTRGVNLFSVKRSQVIFAILAWPELLDGPIREIAGTAQVSLGQAQHTLDLLTQFRLLDERKRLGPHLQDRLLDQWAAAYPAALGSAIKTARFSGEWMGYEASDRALYLSGEAAVPELIRPETAIFYTHGLPTELIRSRRLRRNTERPNIFFREQFWRPPQATGEPGVHTAPWPLIYADLLASGDSRQREVAQALRDRQR